MLNMSPTDTLKILGKWTESSKFINEVAKRLKVSERQAYRLIKKDKQIIKLVLSDRTVLYGLAEFGLPKTEPSTPESSSFLKELATAKEEWIKGLKEDAERRVIFIINSLEPQQQAPRLRLLINERNELLEDPCSLDGGSWIWRHPGVHKFNFQIAREMTPSFIEILYEVQKKGNER